MFNELQAVMNNRAGSPGRFLGWRASLLHSYFSNKNFALWPFFSSSQIRISRKCSAHDAYCQVTLNQATLYINLKFVIYKGGAWYTFNLVQVSRVLKLPFKIIPVYNIHAYKSIL